MAPTADIRVNDMDSWNQSDFNDATAAYLTFAGLPTSVQQHTAHIEPLQDPLLRQTYVHITLDMSKDTVVSPDMETLLHEVYNVRRMSTVIC